MMLKIKFQNSKVNRKSLIEVGYKIHDPHKTFDRKAWIIIGEDGKLYGVDRRKYPVVEVKDYLEVYGDS